jgi:4-hydroxybenzoate polyprenyltransferase
VILMTAAVLSALLPEREPMALAAALAGPWAMGWHMRGLLRGLDERDPASCLAAFRASRDSGAIPVLAFAAALLLGG